MDDKLPVLKVKISKKLNTLTLTNGKSVGTFEIEDGEMDLIKLDVWIGDQLFKEYEKAQLRNKLTGGKDVGGLLTK